MPPDGLLAAAFAAGFFGSSHCLGMCGAVVTMLEQPRLPAGNLPRRIVYNLGRLACYASLGAIAGVAGLVLTRMAGLGTGLLVLRLLAAALVILLALNLLFNLGSLRFVETAGQAIWRRVSPFARYVLPASTLPRAFGAGFIWGALPCGLVYAAVAMAATTGSATSGAALMVAFWAGTLPALLAVGSVASRVGSFARSPGLRRVAGALLLLVGLMALALPLRHAGPDGHSGHESGALSERPAEVHLLPSSRSSKPAADLGAMPARGRRNLQV